MEVYGVASGLKRSRDELTDSWILEDMTANKRLHAASSTSGSFDVDEQDEEFLPASGVEIPSLSTSVEPSEVVNQDACKGTGMEGEMDHAQRLLRSLEEELGVSDTEYSLTASSVDVDELSSSALGEWGADIWNAQSFATADDLNHVHTEVGCSSNSSPALSESVSSGNSRGAIDGDCCETTRPQGTSSVDNFMPVDIGFLLEASDDELGIPPSPSSDRGEEQEQGYEGEPILSGSSLHEAVSWALEGGDDNMAFGDSGIEDWMMGSLDFLVEAPITYPLVEAGLVL